MSRPTHLATPRLGTTQVETTDAQPSVDGAQRPQITGTLRLRGHHTEHDAQRESGASGERRIRWAKDVVDNEGQGKKSSKVCCIYHKPRAVGESSSESESSSDSSPDESDSDSDVDNGEARMANGSRRYRPHGRHGHAHDHDHDHDHCQPASDVEAQQPGPATRKKRSRPKPNAYERMPRYSKKPQS